MFAGKSNCPTSLEENGGIRECPLCAEALDETDLALLPCPCDYQICLWCLQRIRERENNKCPQCRRDYDESSYRRVKVQMLPRVRTSDAEGVRGANVSQVSDSGCKLESQRSSFCEDDGYIVPGVNPLSNSGSRMVSHQHIINYKQPTICRLTNCPSSMMNAQILSSFRYFGKYGKLSSVTICNTKGVDHVFLIYGVGENAAYAIQDFNKYISSGRDSIWKNSKLVLGAAKHCIQSIRGVKCLTEGCPFTHCVNSQNPKHFWKYFRKSPGELNALRPYFPESFIQELVGDMSEDSFFDRTIGDLAAAHPQLSIPQNVLTAAAAAASSRPPKSGDMSDASPVDVASEHRVPRGWKKPQSMLHPKSTSDADNATFPEIQTSVNLVMQEGISQSNHSSNAKKPHNTSSAHPSTSTLTNSLDMPSGESLTESCKVPPGEYDEQSSQKSSSFKVEFICPPPTVPSVLVHNQCATQENSEVEMHSVFQHKPHVTNSNNQQESSPNSIEKIPSKFNPTPQPSIPKAVPQFKVACQSSVGMKVYLPPKNLPFPKPTSMENSMSETDEDSESFELPSNGFSNILEMSEPSHENPLHKSSNESMRPATVCDYGRDAAEMGLYEKARQMVLGRGIKEPPLLCYRTGTGSGNVRAPHLSRYVTDQVNVNEPQGRNYGAIRPPLYENHINSQWNMNPVNDLLQPRVQSVSGTRYNNSYGRVDSHQSDRDTREQTKEDLILDQERMMMYPRVNGLPVPQSVPAGTHMSLTAFLDSRARQSGFDHQNNRPNKVHASYAQSMDGLLQRSGDFWVPNAQDTDIFFNEDRCEDILMPNSQDNGLMGSSRLSSLLMRLDRGRNIYRDNSLVPSTSSVENVQSQETDFSFHPNVHGEPPVPNMKSGLYEPECNISGQSSNPSQLTIDILRSVVPNATINISTNASRFMT